MITVSMLLMRNSNYKTITNSSSSFFKNNIKNNDLFDKRIIPLRDRFLLHYNGNDNNDLIIKKRLSTFKLRNKNSSKSYSKLNINNYNKMGKKLKKRLLSSTKDINSKVLVKNYKLTFNLLNSANNSKEINDQYKSVLRNYSAMKFSNTSRKRIETNFEQINNIIKVLPENKKRKINYIKDSIDFSNVTTNIFYKNKINFNKNNHAQRNRNTEEPITLKPFKFKNNSCNMAIDKNNSLCNKKSPNKEKNIRNIKKKFLEKSYSKEKKGILSTQDLSKVDKNQQKVPLKIFESVKIFSGITDAILVKSKKRQSQRKKNLDIINFL